MGSRGADRTSPASARRALPWPVGPVSAREWPGPGDGDRSNPHRRRPILRFRSTGCLGKCPPRPVGRRGSLRGTSPNNPLRFVTGGTGHIGLYIIPDLIAAGHDVTGLARSDKSAAAVSALGAKVRRGDISDLDGLKAASAVSDGVIHVAHRQDLLPSGGIDAVAAAELQIMLAYGEALAGTGKPLVVSGSIGSPTNSGWPAPGPTSWDDRRPRTTQPFPRWRRVQGFPAGP